MSVDLRPQRQIEIHGTGMRHWMRCNEEIDWSIVFDGKLWIRRQDSARFPLPPSGDAGGRIHIWVGCLGPPVLPLDAAQALAQLCRELMDGYGAARPHLHSFRGPLRTPVTTSGPIRNYPGGPVRGFGGCDAVTLAGHDPAMLPEDCPPWELPPEWWDALYPG